MSRSVAPLFEPFILNGLELPNRVVMAPMTRSKSPGGEKQNDSVGNVGHMKHTVEEFSVF